MNVAAIDRDDELPPEIAERMEAAGLKPEISVLSEIIANFPRMQAEARTKAERRSDVALQWPLKGLLPVDIAYETARRSAERGELRAEKIGGRWFSTEADVQSWLAATGRLKRG